MILKLVNISAGDEKSHVKVKRREGVAGVSVEESPIVNEKLGGRNISSNKSGLYNVWLIYLMWFLC